MLDPNYQYEQQYTVEFESILQWTGNGTLTLAGKTYNQGQLINVGGIEVSKKPGDSNLVLTMAAITEDARDYFNTDPGPKPCRVQMIWRKKLKTASTWNPWQVGITYKGKLSDGSYQNGAFAISVQRPIDEVWRNEPIEWTRSYQRRRYPNDSGLDRADKVRRGLLPSAWRRN